MLLTDLIAHFAVLRAERRRVDDFDHPAAPAAAETATAATEATTAPSAAE